jgi:hypothetical protein
LALLIGVQYRHLPEHLLGFLLDEDDKIREISDHILANPHRNIDLLAFR